MRRFFGVVLSLVSPGLGHLALGRRLRAFGWFALSIGLALASVVSFWCLAAALLVRVPAAIDAAALGPDRERMRGAVGTVVELVVGLIAFTALAAPLRLVLTLSPVPSTSMAPTVLAGDHVVVDQLSYRLRPPARGDLAMFRDPCGSGDGFLKRVVAQAGDTVELRCDVLLINGEEIQARHVDAVCEIPGPAGGVTACSRYVERHGAREIAIDADPGRPALDLAREARDASYDKVAGRGDFPGDSPPTCAGRAPVGSIEHARRQVPIACAPRRHLVVPDGHVFVLGDNRDDAIDSRHFGPVPLTHVEGRVTGIFWSDLDPRRIGPTY